MKNSKNEQVQDFLDEMAVEDEGKFEILQGLHKLVFRVYPQVGERMMYGGIMFLLDGEDFGGIFPSKKHISFEFSQGYKLRDPKKLLEGTGKFRRHLKIVAVGDIIEKEVEFFVRQVCKLG